GSRVSGQILTASVMNAHNTFENPDTVRPAPFTGARFDGQNLMIDLPSKSVVALEIE
ncbi:MAG TPA: alpha-L-arabinofuranosidase C-terminal domain-containing protein, partial [Acidobacteriota bacterium]|nr:alpha-L-arabinofuranosidase C-terminal domain-containing protein [Acidobacteriota bacterium]